MASSQKKCWDYHIQQGEAHDGVTQAGSCKNLKQDVHSVPVLPMIEILLFGSIWVVLIWVARILSRMFILLLMNVQLVCYILYFPPFILMFIWRCFSCFCWYGCMYEFAIDYELVYNWIWVDYLFVGNQNSSH